MYNAAGNKGERFTAIIAFNLTSFKINAYQ